MNFSVCWDSTCSGCELLLSVNGVLFLFYFFCGKEVLHLSLKYILSSFGIFRTWSACLLEGNVHLYCENIGSIPMSLWYWSICFSVCYGAWFYGPLLIDVMLMTELHTLWMWVWPLSMASVSEMKVHSLSLVAQFIFSLLTAIVK